LRALLSLINGPQDIGRSKWFWMAFGGTGLWMILFPIFRGSFAAYDAAYFLINIPLAIGVSLLWGYGGILSFGQVAFFGVAGYVYGLVAGNMLQYSYGTLLASGAALLAAALLASAFGYFIFYGRVQKWILPIMTLVFTLVLERFLAQTAGYQWKLGNVLLGGYNGMTGIPSLQVGNFLFSEAAFYYLTLALVLLCFFSMRIFINSHRGMVVTAIREDEIRTEMLGHDVRLVQLKIFVIAAVLAGLSGLLYAQWGNYINPSSMGILQASLPIIWVAVGGRDSLLSVCISTYLLNYLGYQLASQGSQYSFIIMGFLLVGGMLFFPQGVVVMVGKIKWPLFPRKGTKNPSESLKEKVE
jgi:urea transport system permease protein